MQHGSGKQRATELIILGFLIINHTYIPFHKQFSMVFRVLSPPTAVLSSQEQSWELHAGIINLQLFWEVIPIPTDIIWISLRIVDSTKAKSSPALCGSQIAFQQIRGSCWICKCCKEANVMRIMGVEENLDKQVLSTPAWWGLNKTFTTVPKLHRKIQGCIESQFGVVARN